MAKILNRINVFLYLILFNLSASQVLGHYDLIIIDCDGVLVDSEMIANRVEVEEINKLGYNFTLQEYLKISVGIPVNIVLKNLEKDQGLKFPPNFLEHLSVLKLRAFRNELKPVKNIDKLLQFLKKTKIKYCIGSNSPRKKLLETLTITKLLKYFDTNIVSAEDLSFVGAKPETGLYKEVCRKMGVPLTANILVVEDSKSGIIPAKKLGFKTIGFLGGEHADKELENDLLEAGADVIVHTSKQVIEYLKIH